MEDITRTPRHHADPSPGVVDAVQNPALGAALVWACATGFQDEGARPLPLHLAFLVLPMVLHEQTRDAILGTNVGSGLAKLESKFKGHEDDLLAIHERALLLRPLTLDSVCAGLLSNLLAVDYETALLSPVKLRGRPKQTKPVEQMLEAAVKLGHWFARLPLQQVASLLRVEF
jgi:hypothetical protein